LALLAFSAANLACFSSWFCHRISWNCRAYNGSELSHYYYNSNNYNSPVGPSAAFVRDQPRLLLSLPPTTPSPVKTTRGLIVYKKVREIVCERREGRGKNVRARSLSCNKITARALSLRYETLIHSRDFVPISLIDFTKSGSKGFAASLLIPSTENKVAIVQKTNKQKKNRNTYHHEIRRCPLLHRQQLPLRSGRGPPPR